jgi:D-beta-D-heptose 7-phosphate kinase/D-beta-D-heptose 1-phosphate adenosyltransferase
VSGCAVTRTGHHIQAGHCLLRSEGAFTILGVSLHTESTSLLPLGDLLLRFSAQRIVVVGDVMLDEYIVGESSRISAEAPVPVLQFTHTHAVLGGAANTAANVATLGGHATLIGLAGQDSAGQELAKLCERASIDFRPVHDGRSTTRKIRVTGHQQQFLRLDYEEAGAMAEEGQARVLSLAEEALANANALVISDYAKGLLTEQLCQRLIDLAHRSGLPVVVDPRPQHAAFYYDCDYLTPNWKESQGLLGLSDVAATDDAVERIGTEISERFRANVLVTLGAKGIAFFGKAGGERVLVPTAAREVFDVSGAGDTVVAAFALATATGCAHADAVSVANRAAGIVVGKRGTATVTPDELLAFGDNEPKVLARAELRGLGQLLRGRGKRLVSVNGSFDLLHAGHLHILREAKRQGDVLVVGLNSDASVRSYKGTTRPLIPQAQRAEMLLALRMVDYVHIFDEPVPMPFIEALRPDVHVNGSEYGPDCIEAPLVRSLDARLHIVERLPNLSTSEILHKIGG